MMMKKRLKLQSDTLGKPITGVCFRQCGCRFSLIICKTSHKMNCSNHLLEGDKKAKHRDRAAYHKRYYAENKERILARQKQWRTERMLRLSKPVLTQIGTKSTGNWENIVSRTRSASAVTVENTVKRTGNGSTSDGGNITQRRRNGSIKDFAVKIKQK